MLHSEITTEKAGITKATFYCSSSVTATRKEILKSVQFAKIIV